MTFSLGGILNLFSSRDVQLNSGSTSDWVWQGKAMAASDQGTRCVKKRERTDRVLYQYDTAVSVDEGCYETQPTVNSCLSLVLLIFLVSRLVAMPLSHLIEYCVVKREKDRCIAA